MGTTCTTRSTLPPPQLVVAIGLLAWQRKIVEEFTFQLFLITLSGFYRFLTDDEEKRKYDDESEGGYKQMRTNLGLKLYSKSGANEQNFGPFIPTI